MRQAGPLAAAAILAIDRMAERLLDDHATATRLGMGLAGIDANLVERESVQTNIVKVRLALTGPTADQWSAALRERGILVSPCERHALRFVTHRHITAEHIDHTVSVFRETFEQFEKTRKRALI